ncbi:PTTG1 interacting protein b [Takifugu rubripes]|uniref:PTTG1 interacting protein n=1 Tax=Takifugu rubripes TaxID=31033 RepID=A0A3B5K5F6_TAKRU|nr:pituitary tumor-transforming gene 1 protein-interacting protein [Takifugu rubripes]
MCSNSIEVSCLQLHGRVTGPVSAVHGPSGLTMPVAGRLSALLLAWILCAVTGSSEAQTPAPESRPCALTNSSCDECLKNVSCLWCEPKKLCTDYPVGNVLPPQSLCPLNDARWGVCWVNFQILIITMSVLAGVIIIGVLVCCCFCCCKCEKVGNKREDARMERQNNMRKARQKERRTEMHLRHDEIRQKYGIAKKNPYSRMDED